MEKNEQRKKVYQGLSLFVALACSILFFFLLFRLSEITKSLGVVWKAVAPFVYGAVIAYILNPVCNFFELSLDWLGRKCKMKKPEKLSKPGSVFLSILFLILIVYFLIMSLIPQVYESMVGLVSTLPEKFDIAVEWTEEKLEGQEQLQKIIMDSSEKIDDYFTNFVEKQVIPNIQTYANGVSSGVVSVFSFFKNFFISIIVAIYVLGSRKEFPRHMKILLKSLLKEKHFEPVWEELKFSNRMFSGFISGKLIDSAIIGLITFIVLTIWNMISGFNYVLLVSVMIGVTNIIPFFGPFIGAIPCAFLILLDSPMNCLGFIIFIVILQQVDGNILGPKILGNATGISSFGVLFSVMVFGSVFGFVGMLVGVPVFGIVYDIIMKLVIKGLRRHGSDDLADQCAKEREIATRVKEGKPGPFTKFKEKLQKKN